MATERVYHPETNEPFDVPTSKAGDLRLNKGWNTQPFARVDVLPGHAFVSEDSIFVDFPEDDKPARGRGRRRAQRVEAVAPSADDAYTWRDSETEA